MIVFVHGPDAAIVRGAVADLARAHDPDGVNTTVFDANETPLPRIAAAAGSAGFFGTGRVVVVRDLMAHATRRKAGTGGDEGDGPAGSGLDLAPLFAAVAPDNLLVLADPSLSAVPAAVKKAAPADVRTIAGEPPRGRDLIGWIVRAAVESGGEIEAAAAKLLAETLYPQTWAAKPANPRYDRPPDLDLIRSRLETLVLYAHPRPVGMIDIRRLVEGAPDDRIFRFLEAATTGDLATAVAELEQLLLAGEEPGKLLAQLYGQVELAVIAEAGGSRDAAEIAREIGAANAGQLAAVARAHRGRSAKPALAAALDTDRALKTGRLRQPLDALVQALVRLAGAQRQGPGCVHGPAPDLRS